MQQSPIRWRETKALFFVQSGLWSPFWLRRRGPSAVWGGAFAWDRRAGCAELGGPQGPWDAESCSGRRTCVAYSEPLGGSVRPVEKVLGILGPRAPRCAPKSRAHVRKAARQRARGGLLCIMCGSALAFLTAALLCLHNCQRGPALVLRAAWLFSLVLGLGQSGKLFCFVFFPSPKVLGWHWELLAWAPLTGKWQMSVLVSPETSGGWLCGKVLHREARCQAFLSWSESNSPWYWKSSSWVKFGKETVVLTEANSGVPVFPENVTV